MKILFAVLLFATVFSLSSCVTNKTYTVEEKKMVYEGDPVFIIKTDGEKISGKKLDFPRNMISVDGQKFQENDVTALQDKTAYCVRFRGMWIRQLKRGKVNLYHYEVFGDSYGGHNSDHFVFQKGEGKLLELSLEGISEFLKDNPQAQAKFDAEFRPGRVWLPKHLQNHPEALFDIIDLYNAG